MEKKRTLHDYVTDILGQIKALFQCLINSPRIQFRVHVITAAA